ncbi:septation protein SepH [Corynebacterium variabile]|uniref:septation protein SepH n=1 Tax=Corynebacterium variabile TaxID=1727 RepID=UPI003FD6B7C6
MQELEFVPDDSDAASLVLRDPGSDRLYWIPVTDALRDHITVARELAAEEGGDTSADGHTAVTTTDTTTDTAESAASAEPETSTGDADPAPALSVTAVERPAEEPKPKVKLRPREIQKRLRHGATVAELMEETGAPESRLTPYAHPIQMERHRIAELARQAYPVLSDGPAEHTLWESLATAFAARQEDVRASTWDAAMDSSDDWIITVTWTRGNRHGATQFAAEFRWVPAPPPGTGPSTVEPANSVANDLVDPRFNRPVRTVSAPAVEDEDAALDEDAPVDDPADWHDIPASGNRSTDDEPGIAPTVDLFGDPTPDQRSHPAKRKRSTSTPHWEDVLLGVRTSPRKKK